MNRFIPTVLLISICNIIASAENCCGSMKSPIEFYEFATFPIELNANDKNYKVTVYRPKIMKCKYSNGTQGCCPGYETSLIHGCSPICSKCNSLEVCMKPEDCRCQEGYVREGPNCTPICPKGCPALSKCVKPNECKCIAKNEKLENNECVSICKYKCPEHGECNEDGSCKCDTGYKLDDYENDHFTRCAPQCDSCGKNALCKEPGKCICNNGYKDVNGICEPECKTDCGPYGICSDSGNEISCRCNDGYAKVSEQPFQCAPYCSSCKSNEICEAPQTCSCDKGYKRVNEACEPLCSTDCGPDRICTAPDICKCQKGYDEEGIEPVKCVPHCSSCRSNEICEAPEKCSCDKGYQNVNEICVPFCTNGCPDNAICTAPDICSCLKEYDPVDSPLTKCLPHCSSCGEHQFCEKPEQCNCIVGYKNLMGVCVPVCTKDCPDHFICSDPEICTCKEGYENIGDKCQEVRKNNDSTDTYIYWIIGSIIVIILISLLVGALFYFRKDRSGPRYITEFVPNVNYTCEANVVVDTGVEMEH